MNKKKLANTMLNHLLTVVKTTPELLYLREEQYYSSLNIVLKKETYDTSNSNYWKDSIIIEHKGSYLTFKIHSDNGSYKSFEIKLPFLAILNSSYRKFIKIKKLITLYDQNKDLLLIEKELYNAIPSLIEKDLLKNKPKL